MVCCKETEPIIQGSGVMALVLELETVVQPDGKIEITSPELVPGQRAKVTIEIEDEDLGPPQRAIDILDELPGYLEFQTAEEVDAYIREERDSWASSPRT
jgi:hypothetical protein